MFEAMSSFISALVASIAFLPPEPKQLDHWHYDVHYLSLPKCGMRVPAVMIPYEGAECTMLMCHGNAGAAIRQQHVLAKLGAAVGCNIAMFEYPGYPSTIHIDEEKHTESFAPTEEATYEAAEATLRWLLEDMHIDPKRLIIRGLSLGSGVATHLALHCAQKDIPLGGLLLVSPIASAFRVVLPGLWWTLPFDIFVNVDKIGQIRCKVTIIHGTSDGVVPIANSYLLAQRAPPALLMPAPLYIQGADHGNVESIFVAQWTTRVRQFVALVCGE